METFFKPLRDLITELNVLSSHGDIEDCQVSNIVADSRKVVDGALFVAVRGGSVDGHAYIQDAVINGAAAVLGDMPLQGMQVPYIQVENSRKALAFLSAAYYGYPARKLTVIGITGTDGKTTTSNLLFQILKNSDIKVGMITTVNAVIGTEELDTGFHVTTPDAPEVQRYLARMVDSGLTHVILEATSHGLSQFRVDACDFDIGIITNITHEHLDFHGSYEEYRSAKARLFKELLESNVKDDGVPKLAVLNLDDESFDHLNSEVHVKKICYGLRKSADVQGCEIKSDKDGIHFFIMGKNYRVDVKSPLVGEYNASNILAAFTAAVEGLAIDPLAASRGIALMQRVPGRMERIEMGQPFTAIVDFAHTPNALRVAIDSAKKLATGKVIAVFGSAGLRDREKRRLMAEVSAERAHITILTAEDPRTESLDEILSEMAHGVESRGGIEGESYWKFRDRGEAIRFAVNLADPGDIVLACGKGHEQSMCFGTTEYPWDDRTAMKAALSELLNIAGPSMPFLPTQD